MCLYIYIYYHESYMLILHLITRNIHPTRIGHTLQFDQDFCSCHSGN